MDCLVDPFVMGRLKLKSVKDQHVAEIALERGKVELIWLSVQYFREKRRIDGIELKTTVDEKRSAANDDIEFVEWESAMIEAMEELDLEEYFKSNN
jgi:hypothetical protein